MGRGKLCWQGMEPCRWKGQSKHRWRSLMAKKIAAILPCLGEASRMRPLSLGTPKAFLPFCGRQLVEYILEQLARDGIRTAVLVVGLCDAHHEQCVCWGRKRGLKISVAKRSLQFGSAGVVRHVIETLTELNKFTDFLVIY